MTVEKASKWVTIRINDTEVSEESYGPGVGSINLMFPRTRFPQSLPFDNLEIEAPTNFSEIGRIILESIQGNIVKGDTHSREYLDAFHAAIMAHKDIDPAHKDAAHKAARGGAGGKLRGRGNPQALDEGAAEQDDLEPEEEQDREEVSTCNKALQVEICKVADNTVYGIVLRAGVADLQGDVMNKEDIAKACHDYMEEYRTINVGHKENVDACPVECWIAKEPGKLGKRKYGEGDWLMGTRINDPETLAKVNTGLLKSYSIEGEGVRIPM